MKFKIIFKSLYCYIDTIYEDWIIEPNNLVNMFDLISINLVNYIYLLIILEI